MAPITLFVAQPEMGIAREDPYGALPSISLSEGAHIRTPFFVYRWTLPSSTSSVSRRLFSSPDPTLSFPSQIFAQSRRKKQQDEGKKSFAHIFISKKKGEEK